MEKPRGVDLHGSNAQRVFQLWKVNSKGQKCLLTRQRTHSAEPKFIPDPSIFVLRGNPTKNLQEEKRQAWEQISTLLLNTSHHGLEAGAAALPFSQLLCFTDFPILKGLILLA